VSNVETNAEFKAEEYEAASIRVTQTSQFSLLTLFWCMLAWMLLLAYAKTTGRQGPVQASVFMALGLGAGLLVGLVAGRIRERLYWASLISVLAFLAVAGGSLRDAGVFYGWGFVGSIWGALFPSRKPKNAWKRSVLFAVLGGAGMLESNILINRFVTPEGWFDISTAMFIGALLGPLSKTAVLFDAKNKNLRILLASCLVVSVLIGNWLVPILGGVNR
jgi:hypothetical protein